MDPGMIELVTWRDAHFSLTDDFREEDDYLMETVGWVRVDGRWLRIEGEHGPDDTVRQVTRVPLENVINREPLFMRST